MANRQLLIRFIAGLLIASPAAYIFGKPPMVDEARSQLAAHSVLQPASHMPGSGSVIQAALDAEAAEDEATLKALGQAFKPLETELLWCDSISLNAQGPDATQNVRLAAEAVDFTVVYPEDIFSFNRIVGVRSEDKGYRPGLMYSGGEVITGIGGGICILATLLYKGALETGLQIIERHPHSGPVSYAEPGLDSAVSYGWADLRFKNDSEHLVLIRAKVEKDQVVVAFYGTPDRRRRVEVVAEDYEEIPYEILEVPDESVPEGEVVVKQTARTGYRVSIVRVISEDGKVVKREVISRDTMLPRNKIVFVPPIQAEASDQAVKSGGKTNQVDQAPLQNRQPLPDLPSLVDDADVPHPIVASPAESRVQGRIILDE